MAAFGASPVNRLEIETPSSASRPWPVLARVSMIEASSGRLATSTRSRSRSYQRNAGTPSALPCRIACWLAGVVHGTWTIHSWTAWLPLSSQRRSVGIVPDCSTHCMTGNDTPSSWTNTTPSTSGSGISPGLILQQAGREGLVGAGADEPDEQGAEGSSEPGRRDGRPERVERRAGDDVHGQLHHDRLPEQGRQRHGDPPDGGRDLDEDRSHDHAEQTGHRQRRSATATTTCR